MYSTFFLGTLYLEHVRHYSALQTGRGVPALDAHRRGPLAGHHRAAGRALRRDRGAHRRAWRARSSGCSCSPPSGRTPRFFPTIFVACFAIGLGHRQRVHAAADDRDGRRARRRRRARLRDHQRLPADQRRARARGAQHDRHQPHEEPAVRRPRADQLPDRRLPPRLHRRRRRDRRRDRPRLRAPATAQRRARRCASHAPAPPPSPLSPWRNKPHDHHALQDPPSSPTASSPSYIHDISSRPARRQPPVEPEARPTRRSLRRVASTQETLSYTPRQ